MTTHKPEYEITSRGTLLTLHHCSLAVLQDWEFFLEYSKYHNLHHFLCNCICLVNLNQARIFSPNICPDVNTTLAPAHETWLKMLNLVVSRCEQCCCCRTSRVSNTIQIFASYSLNSSCVYFKKWPFLWGQKPGTSLLFSFITLETATGGRGGEDPRS